MQKIISISDINKDSIDLLIKKSIQYFKNGIKKNNILTNTTIISLFLEPSTRTMLSFAIAAQKLGGNTINVPIENSSIKKGESIIDTIKTINSMFIDTLIIRTPINDLSEILESCKNCNIINAGNGIISHPTQALLDIATIQHFKNNINNLNITICGDTAHSRVARSTAELLELYNANITIISPENMMLKNKKYKKSYILDDDIIANQDVIIILRPQKERMKTDMQIKEYIDNFCITEKTLKILKSDAIIMHPGPMNIGLELSKDVINDKRFIAQYQVKMGVCARAALFEYIHQN